MRRRFAPRVSTRGAFVIRHQQTRPRIKTTRSRTGLRTRSVIRRSRRRHDGPHTSCGPMCIQNDSRIRRRPRCFRRAQRCRYKSTSRERFGRLGNRGVGRKVVGNRRRPGNRRERRGSRERSCSSWRGLLRTDEPGRPEPRPSIRCPSYRPTPPAVAGDFPRTRFCTTYCTSPQRACPQPMEQSTSRHRPRDSFARGAASTRAPTDGRRASSHSSADSSRRLRAIACQRARSATT